MTTEQSRSFEEWEQNRETYSYDNCSIAMCDEKGAFNAGLQASRTSLLAEIQSPECVEEVARAMYDNYCAGFLVDGHAGGYCKEEYEADAQAAISVIVKKMKGEK